MLEFRLLFRRDKHPGAVGAHLTGAVKLAIMAISAARSRSASSAIISGDLPPSSMVTSFSDEAAELAITFAAGDAAGEGYFGDVRMLGQILAGFRADPRQDVKHPSGRPASL